MLPPTSPSLQTTVTPSSWEVKLKVKVKLVGFAVIDQPRERTSQCSIVPSMNLANNHIFHLCILPHPRHGAVSRVSKEFCPYGRRQPLAVTRRECALPSPRWSNIIRMRSITVPLKLRRGLYVDGLVHDCGTTKCVATNLGGATVHRTVNVIM